MYRKLGDLYRLDYTNRENLEIIRKEITNDIIYNMKSINEKDYLTARDLSYIKSDLEKYFVNLEDIDRRLKYLTRIERFKEEEIKKDKSRKPILYKLYIDFFDMKISFSEFIKKYKTLYQYDCNSSWFKKLDTENQLTTWRIEEFIKDDDHIKYAKEKYGIDDFKLYVESKPFFEMCFNNYQKFINHEITLGEYYKKIEKLEIDRDDYLDVVLSYAIDIKKMSKEELDKFKERGIISYYVLNSIDNCSSEEELSILTDYGEYNSKGIKYGQKKLDYLRTHVFDYAIKYKPELGDNEFFSYVSSLRKKINNVIQKYSIINNEIKKKEKENVKINHLNDIAYQSSILVSDFITSDIPISQYLLNKEITQKDFDEALESIKINNVELYKEYSDYINSRQSQTYAVIMSKANKIINYIKNGIVDEKTKEKRNFDILDYYIYSHLTKDEFIDLIRGKCSKSDYANVIRFFNQYKGPLDDSVNIRKMKYTINSMEITTEQKNIIINYLRNINAPVNIVLFRLALKRYLNNTLFVETDTQNEDININTSNNKSL